MATDEVLEEEVTSEVDAYGDDDDVITNGSIYCITNVVNSKKYVGQTIRSVKKRLSEHFADAKRGKTKTKFSRALLKYGKEAFKLEVLEKGITSMSTLNTLEIQYIKTFNTCKNGYNITEGGYNAKTAESTRALFRARKCSAETKQKLSNIMRGNKYSDPTILKRINEERTDKTSHTFYHAKHGAVTGYCAEVANTYNLSVSALHAVVNGTYRSTRGWTLIGSTTHIRMQTYALVNVHTGKELVGTIQELAALTSTTVNNMTKLCNKTTKQTRHGWEFLGVYNG